MALKTTRGDAGGPEKGRGAPSNLEGRFEQWLRESVDDGWAREEVEPRRLETVIVPEKAKSLISRNDSPDIPFDQSINPYRGCEHGCSYCLDGATAIQMADGSTRPLAELNVGDEIIGTERVGHYRRYRGTKVLAHWRTLKPAYQIHLADGTELIASGDHRFLTERGWKYVAPAPRPRQRPFLTRNNSLMGFGKVQSPAPRNAGAGYRRGYLCGLVKGDGHLGVYHYRRPGRSRADQYRFRLAMADAEPLDRAAQYLVGFGIGTDRFLYSQASATRKRIEAIRTSAASSVLELLRLTDWPERYEDEWARGFVAGIFDAEGAYSNGAIRIANTDPAMIENAKLCLARHGFDTVIERSERGRTKPIEYLRVRGGLKEHLRFFMTFDPSIVRKRDIACQSVKSTADLRIVRIEPVPGVQALFDITTGTGDFIANGVVSHNCYARPAHAYVGLSPGLDFETRILFKENAASLLTKELAAPAYRCSPIALGSNTDPYQPAERDLRVTRSILEVLAGCEHPFTIVTKNALVERDLDLIAPMAAKDMARVYLSITNLDNELSRKLEPRASAPYRRIEAIRRLAGAGVPVGVLVAPVIPFVTDRFMEEILERAAAAGATGANFILLRLPHEVAPLMKDWLATHYPLKAEHVMSLVRQMRGGKDYEAAFATRQRGTGEFAELLRKRFELACRRFGLDHGERKPLDTTRFRPPRGGPQLELF